MAAVGSRNVVQIGVVKGGCPIPRDHLSSALLIFTSCFYPFQAPDQIRFFRRELFFSRGECSERKYICRKCLEAHMYCSGGGPVPHPGVLMLPAFISPVARLGVVEVITSTTSEEAQVPLL